MRNKTFLYFFVLMVFFANSLSYASLKADYHFDECIWSGTPGEVHDFSGNHYDGYSFNVLTVDNDSVDGMICKVADFTKPGTDDYLEIDNNAVNGLDDFTISFWLKTTQSNDFSILSSANINNDNELLIFFPSNGTQFRGFIHNRSQIITLDNRINDGRWHHFVWTRSGENTCIIVDGNVSEKKCTTISGISGYTLNVEKVILGQDQDSVGGGFVSYQAFNGYLDELKIFNEVLSDSQIADIYQNEKNRLNWDGSVRNCNSCPEPIGEYHFDECVWDGTQGEVIDEIASQNLTSQNGAFTTEGLVCRSGEFDGSDDKVIGDFVYDFGNEVTITVWIKTSGGHDSYARVVELTKSGDSYKYSTALAYDRYGKTIRGWTRTGRVVLNNEVTYNLDANGLHDDNWHFLAYTYDGSIAKLYVDGVEVDSKNFTISNITDPIHIAIGGYYLNTNYSFNGGIDEVKIYDKALDANTIYAIYNNEKKGKNWNGEERTCTFCGDPTGDWRFDECSWNGTTNEVLDYSGNSLDGTAINGTVNTEDGFLCRAGEFDGIDDFITISDNDLLDNTDELTISAWIYPTQLINNNPGANARGILSKRANVGVQQAYDIFFYDNNGMIDTDGDGDPDKARVYIDINSDRFSSTNYIEKNKWTHIAVVFNKGVAKIYFNGTLDSIHNIASTTIPNYASDLYIGNLYSGNVMKVFKGKIDEVKIFRGVLDDDQINSLYNNEKDGKNFDGAIRNCLVCSELTPIEFEGGTIRLNDTYENPTWNHITFKKPFLSVPVVFIVINSYGSNPATARIKNVTTTGFDVMLVEPQGEDGQHWSQELNYFAVNKGIHKLGNHYLEVGTIDTNKVQGKYAPPQNNIGWEVVTPKISFGRPAIVANIQTINNLDSNIPYDPLIPWGTAVVTLNDNGTFNLAIDMSETSLGVFDDKETVGYMIADSNFTDSFVDDFGNSIIYEVQRKDVYFKGWDNGCVKADFLNDYSEIPLIAGWKDSRLDSDGGWFRRCYLDNESVGFVIDEDRSHDSERSHGFETGAFFAFSDDFHISKIDHYEIIHDGSGLTCQPEEITIKACTDSSYPCNEFTAQSSVTLNYASNSTDYTFIGNTAGEVIYHSPGTITLSLSNMSPEATNGFKCINTTNNTEDCDITFYDSGFIFDIENDYSCKTQTVEIKAVRKDDQTEKCIPGFQNVTIPVDFSFNYVSPDNGTIKPKINNQTLNSTIDLTFDSNGESSFNIQYSDAGEISITATFDNGTLYATGSDTAIFKPFGFYIYSSDANWKADNGSDSTVFKKAGEGFNLSAKAVCWQSDTDTDLSDNPITANYNRSGISVSHNLIEPAGGNNGSVSVHTMDFTNGKASIIESFSEVGVIDFIVTDSDYLGSGQIESVSEHFGRFTPHHFTISNKINGVLINSCNTFSYTGQIITYLTQPSFVIEAKNLNNTITQNYKDDYFKLDISGVQIVSPSQDDIQIGADGTNKVDISISRAIATLNSNNDGTATYTFGFDNITYVRNENSKIAPFTPQFSFLIDNITDEDNIYLSNKDNITVSGSLLKYGILAISDNYGPETENLSLPTKTLYFDGNTWKLNTDDSCTILNNSDFTLDNFTQNLQAGETSIISVEGINQGVGKITLSAPGENNYGSVNVCINPSASFYNYLNDNNLSCATATFGIYRGRDRIIEWLEIPPN